jgi:hypothetical protein
MRASRTLTTLRAAGDPLEGHALRSGDTDDFTAGCMLLVREDVNVRISDAHQRICREGLCTLLGEV